MPRVNDHPARIIQRRPSGRRLAAVAAALLSALVSLPALAAPNIVFILTDDLDTASFEAAPDLQQVLSAKGTTFTNYFVSDSLCCPSRSTILRGQYVHNHHVATNSPPRGGYTRYHDLGHEEDDLPLWMKRAGYRTALFGKYLNGYPKKVGSSYVPPGWDEWDVPVHGTPYGGFDYTLNENGRTVSYGHGAGDHLTDVIARKAAAFIRRAGPHGPPLFLYVAPHSPHLPATPPLRYASAFEGTRAPRTPAFNEADVSDKPRWIAELPPLTAEEIARIDLDYRRRRESMLAVRDLVNRIVEALEATGRMENTWLFFTSDNGFHMGQHRLVAGKQYPYEEDVKVPLVVVGPGVTPGGAVEALAGNVDLAPTFLDLAGRRGPEFLDGRSLVPLLRPAPGPGSAAPEPWRRAYLLEHVSQKVTEEESDRADPETRGTREPTDHPGAYSPPDFDGLRTTDALYVEFKTGEREYYDLRADPNELTNAVGEADPAELHHLSLWLHALATCAGEACRVMDAGAIAAVPSASAGAASAGAAPTATARHGRRAHRSSGVP